MTRLRVSGPGWWVHIKYYLLLGTLVAALGGVLVSGFVSAIPVVTRAAYFLIAPLQLGWFRGWHQVPPMGAGAEMLEGSTDEITAKLIDLLKAKGGLK